MALPDPVVGLVRLVHIGSAIVWVGFIWFSAFVWAPTAKALPPEAQRQVAPHLVKRSVPWMAWSSVLSMAGGITLYADLGYAVGFDAIPMLLNVGVVGAFLMFIIAHAIAVPTGRQIARVLTGGPAVEPPRVARLLRWTRVNVALSVVVVTAMVMASRL